MEDKDNSLKGSDQDKLSTTNTDKIRSLSPLKTRTESGTFGL